MAGTFLFQSVSLGDCIPFFRGAIKADARQAGVSGERIITNARDAVRNGDARQSCTINKGTLANACHTLPIILRRNHDTLICTGSNPAYRTSSITIGSER